MTRRFREQAPSQAQAQAQAQSASSPTSSQGSTGEADKSPQGSNLDQPSTPVDEAEPAFEEGAAATLLLTADQMISNRRHDAALTTIHLAIDLLRTSPQPRTLGCSQLLAASLFRYSTSLDNNGKRADALMAIEEGVQVCKATCLAGFAKSKYMLLRLLGFHHKMLLQNGKERQAFIVLEQCIDVLRGLHRTNPQPYEQALAQLLQYYAAALDHARRGEDARLVMEESVRLWRIADWRDPGKHEAALAMALLSGIIFCKEQHQLDTAFSMAQESVQILKALYRANPDEHHKALIAALHFRSQVQLARNWGLDAINAVLDEVEIDVILDTHASKSTGDRA